MTASSHNNSPRRRRALHNNRAAAAAAAVGTAEASTEDTHKSTTGIAAVGPAATSKAASTSAAAPTTTSATTTPPVNTPSTTSDKPAPTPSSASPSPSTAPATSAAPTTTPPATPAVNTPSASDDAPAPAASSVHDDPKDHSTDSTPPLAFTSDTLASESAAPSAISSGKSSSSGSSSSGFTSNTLIGVIVGGGVFVILLVGCCWFMGRQRRKRAHIRSALDDDVLGPGPGINWRRRTQRLSRSGWRRSLDAEPKDLRGITPPPDPTPYPLPTLSHGEARDTVQVQGQAYPLNNVGGHGTAGGLFVPPNRGHAYGYQPSDASSMWADNTEADMYANDGSTIARTASTVTRPNSEYSAIENDPGATLHQAYIVQPQRGALTPMAHSMYSEGAFMSARSTATFGGGAGGGPGFAPMAYPPSQLGAGGAYIPQQAFAPGGSSTYMSGTMSPPHAPAHPHAQYYDASHGPMSPPAQMQQLHMQQQMQQQPQQRIPAPRLLVDTKAPIIWDHDQPSAVSSAGPSSYPASASSTFMSSAPLMNNVAPVAGAPRQLTSPTAAQQTASFATQTRSLVQPRPPTVVDPPYSTTAPGPTPNDPAVLAAVAAGSAAAPATGARPPTIVRHADGGAFDDALPAADASGALHLPPAYGDIYGPSETLPDRRA